MTASLSFTRVVKFALVSLITIALLAFVDGCQADAPPQPPETWRGVHILVDSDKRLATFEAGLPQFALLGINVVVVEVNYHFEFQSHPELRDKPYVTKAKAQEFVKAAHRAGIRVIPEIDCLGHQSSREHTHPLLSKYPQFDETRGMYPGNKGINCRSWCPQSPDLMHTVYPLIDEVTDAFDANAFHAGMDEVFIIADFKCPRCHGQDPAKLFAQTVNDLHHHIVDEKKLTMLMWGDRFLDAQTMHYGRWESATNGTAPAVDLVPKDIIVCDWHYRAQTNYPSVPFLLSKGFRVWPSGFQPTEAAKALSDFALAQRKENPRVIGYLATTWSQSKTNDLAAWPPITKNLPAWINQ